MARWSGVHINGWHDFAARDWDAEDPDECCDPPIVIDGGPFSVAVRKTGSIWIGGPQATLSPIGRGRGWGDVGAAEHRVQLAEILDRLRLDKDPVASMALRGTVAALSRMAEKIIFVVPDLPDFAEAAQGRTLEALRDRRGARPALLWRSIALILDLIQSGAIEGNKVGLRVRTLIHDSQGIEVQDLVLATSDFHVGHVAPQRNGFGRLILPEVGLRSLHDRSMAALTPAADEFRTDRIERPRSPALALLQEDGADYEILRRWTRNWYRLEVQPPALDLPHLAVPAYDGEVCVFCSPLIGQTRSALFERIQHSIPGLIDHPWEGIARGALAAGRSIERGMPHYYDRLEPIALAVMTANGAQFVPLIAEGASVPANREYVSPEMTGFQWASGQSRVEFFVLKGSDEVRKWAVEKEAPPLADVNVTLQLRQTPGQSWAQLRATSSDWIQLAEQPIHLDWEALHPDERSPADILRTLERPAPKCPERVVEPAHIDFWNGQLFDETLADHLQGSAEDMYGLANRSARFAVPLAPDERGPKYHPISTDGEVPVELDQEVVAALDAAITRLASNLRKQMKSGQMGISNRSFLVLSWFFGRCPEWVQEEATLALEGFVSNRRHPFHDLPSARKVLQQGAGRSVTRPDLVSRLLRVLANFPRPNSDTRGALSFVLSRREGVGHALDARLVEDIGNALLAALQPLVTRRSFQTDFSYTINALTGLLRIRESERRALVADRSPLAARIRDVLAFALTKLPKSGLKYGREIALQAIMTDLIAFYEGTGGDPNLLRRIDALED